MKTILSSKGYYIPKSDLPSELEKNLVKELIITPVVKTDYIKKVESFSIFDITPTHYIVPRLWGITNFGLPKYILFNKIKKIDVEFKGKLRPYQEIIVNKILKVFSKDLITSFEEFKKHKTKENIEKLKENIINKKGYGSGIICIPPGGGKTVIGIYTLAKLKVKTLIVVHKTFLMDQWIERLREYIPDVSIGTIRQKIFDIENRDVVILMAQTGYMHDFNEDELEQLQTFSFVIIDEVHHFAAKVFSQILKKFQSPYILGLSATPEREDKLENVFYYHIGNIIHRSFSNNDTIPTIIVKHFESTHKKFKIEYTRFSRKIDMSTMITNLIEIDERNTFIFEIIKELLIESPSRKIFVLTNRREHIIKLNHLLVNYDVGIYVGGMKKEALKESETKNIILGTYEMASEGLDIQDLDTLILGTPKSNITQSVGRILRKESHMYENYPMVVDIVDRINVFYGMYNKRQKIYMENKYKIVKNGIVQSNEIKENLGVLSDYRSPNKSEFIDD